MNCKGIYQKCIESNEVFPRLQDKNIEFVHQDSSPMNEGVLIIQPLSKSKDLSETYHHQLDKARGDMQIQHQVVVKVKAHEDV